MTAEHGDESLERAGRVLGQLFSPKQLGEAIGRHPMSARGEQDLEHLLRACAAQVAWAERAGAVFNRKYSEESDHHPLPTLLTSGHAHLRFERPPGRASSQARPACKATAGEPGFPLVSLPWSWRARRCYKPVTESDSRPRQA